MGYQIRYNDTSGMLVINKKTGRKNKGVMILLVSIILAATVIMAVNGYLIPGDASVTKSAVKTFQQEIKRGEDIGKAFTAFCKEIVDGANLS